MREIKMIWGNQKPRSSFSLSLRINHMREERKEGPISDFRHNTWLRLGTQPPGRLLKVYFGVMCIALCQHYLFPQPGVCRVSSETVPQQLVYKLERAGAGGRAQIGTLLGVIFHSISNLFFFLRHSVGILLQSSFASFGSSPAASIAFISVLQGDLHFLAVMQWNDVFSKKGRDALYKVYVFQFFVYCWRKRQAVWLLMNVCCIS